MNDTKRLTYTHVCLFYLFAWLCTQCGKKNKVFRVWAQENTVWKRNTPIGVVMKDQGVWKVRSCPGYWLSNAKEQMTPIHRPGLSCYCTLIAWGIVLLEFFLLQLCASRPCILGGGREAAGSCSLKAFISPPPTLKAMYLDVPLFHCLPFTARAMHSHLYAFLTFHARSLNWISWGWKWLFFNILS